MDIQDIISLNLQRAVQPWVDIAALLVVSRNLQSPANMAEAFVRLRENGWITEDIEQFMHAVVRFSQDCSPRIQNA